MKQAGLFSRMAKYASKFAGRPLAFNLAIGLVVLWLLSGPIFKFSDTWQLVINTGTTIITFLMVFLIQNSQNRDTAAMQIKLDEVIRATQGAHNAVVDTEELEEEDIEKEKKRYGKLANAARDPHNRTHEQGTPELDKSDQPDEPSVIGSSKPNKP